MWGCIKVGKICESPNGTRASPRSRWWTSWKWGWRPECHRSVGWLSWNKENRISLRLLVLCCISYYYESLPRLPSSSLRSQLHTVWKSKKFTPPTEKYFREMSSFVPYLVKTLFSRNFCQKSVGVNFRYFHTVAAVAFFSPIFHCRRQTNGFISIRDAEYLWERK